jgi:hypothetical protein
MWIFFIILSILPLPLLGSVAAGHRTIRFLLILHYRTFSTIAPLLLFGVKKVLTNFWQIFWQIFENFLKAFWHFLKTFWHFLKTFWDFFLLLCYPVVATNIMEQISYTLCLLHSLLHLVSELFSSCCFCNILSPREHRWKLTFWSLCEYVKKSQFEQNMLSGIEIKKWSVFYLFLIINFPIFYFPP